MYLAPFFAFLLEKGWFTVADQQGTYTLYLGVVGRPAFEHRAHLLLQSDTEVAIQHPGQHPQR